MSSAHGLIVVGSGPAGVAAARAYEEAGGPGPVLLLSADETAPYERPLLSKGLLSAQDDPEPVPLGEAGRLRETQVRLGCAVTSVDLTRRTLRAGGELLAFERLVLAPGAVPLPLPSAEEGADVHVLRSFADLTRLHAAAAHARTALVVGSGFVGCEAAIALAHRGIDVEMVTTEAAPQIGRLGERAAALVADLLTGHGVRLSTGVGVRGVRAPRTVHLGDGRTLEPDLLLVAVGVRAATDFLDGSGLTHHQGRVVVDETLQAAERVWVAGDAALAHHGLAARPLLVEHWGDAVAMGEVAGANAAAWPAPAPRRWEGVPGFWTSLGEHRLKYSAWGDGHDEVVVDERPGRLTVWYGHQGRVVGVLAYRADEDYARGGELVRQGAALAAAVRGDAPEAGGEGGG